MSQAARIQKLLGACSTGDLDAVNRILRKRDGLVNAVDNTSFTPLIVAIQNGHEAVVRLLLKHGATVDQAANNGATSLYIASQNGHEPVVRLLLERGAAIEHAANSGATSLFVASLEGSFDDPLIRAADLNVTL